MAEPIRVQKAIAQSGLMSRRAAESAIAEGRVKVGGKIAVLGDRVNPELDPVLLDDAPIPINPALETHLLYKPVGVISTADDPQRRRTVVDMIAATVRLYPVGRLDADSEGLILVTNDGELANLVTHPSHGITKKYVVLVAGRPKARDVRRLVQGVDLDDGPAHAVSARLIDSTDATTMIEMTMLEGRNREIRRMMDAIGFSVVRLVRTAIGPLSDPNLGVGESRLLSSEEVWAISRTAVTK